MQKKPYEPPTITKLGCASREHIENINNPGHCLWCDAPMRELAPITEPEMRTALLEFLTGPVREPPEIGAVDAFHELALSLTPELGCVLRAVAYGATLAIESGSFGFRAQLRAGSRHAAVHDQQLSHCIMALAATWERS